MMAFVARTPHSTLTETALLADPHVASDDPGLASFRDADTPGDLA
jgi:hypothetical protein